jgi:hypothetical protein
MEPRVLRPGAIGFYCGCPPGSWEVRPQNYNLCGSPASCAGFFVPNESFGRRIGQPAGKQRVILYDSFRPVWFLPGAAGGGAARETRGEDVAEYAGLLKLSKVAGDKIPIRPGEKAVNSPNTSDLNQRRQKSPTCSQVTSGGSYLRAWLRPWLCSASR